MTFWLGMGKLVPLVFGGANLTLWGCSWLELINYNLTTENIYFGKH